MSRRMMICALATVSFAVWSTMPAGATVPYTTTNLGGLDTVYHDGDDGVPPNINFNAQSLTGSGAVYGVAQYQPQGSGPPPLPTEHVGYWANGTFTDLGGPMVNTDDSLWYRSAYGDNAGDVMVSALSHGIYSFSVGTTTALPSGLGDSPSRMGNNMSSSGWLGGFSGADNQAFAYNANTGVVYKFGDAGAFARGINNSGAAVGYVGTGGSPFTWTQAGGVTPIASESTLYTAVGISNNGKYIVGANSSNQAVVYNTAGGATTIDTSGMFAAFPLGLPDPTPVGTTLSAIGSQALYVNNSGYVVGQTTVELAIPGEFGVSRTDSQLGWLAKPAAGGGYQPAVSLGTMTSALPGDNIFKVTGLNDNMQILLQSYQFSYYVPYGGY